MAQNDNNKIKLEMLVDELLKEQPRKQVVKDLTSDLGMEYSGDPIVQMNTVLQSMNSLLIRSNRKKELEG